MVLTDLEGSFVSLLNNDSYEFEDVFSQPPSQSQSRNQQSQPQQDVVNSKKGKRSKNFLIEEDMLLISAWLNVSMDSVQGNNQTHTRYWDRIWKYFGGKKAGTASASVR